MYKSNLINDLMKAITEIGYSIKTIDLSVPEKEKFGDYTTNIALQLAKDVQRNGKQSSFDIANRILNKFGHPSYLERVDIAGPGFMNFYLKAEALLKILQEKPAKLISKEKFLIEYSQPNTHKAYHIGHLRNITLGESISRLFEFRGAEVYRVTYGGDIGPHVAKALWAIDQSRDEYTRLKENSTLEQKAEFLGKAYVLGSKAYSSDPKAKKEIDNLNIKLYRRDKDVSSLWEETKNWSIAYFESIYSKLGTEFDREIWESEVEAEGTKIVKENIGKVFKEDDGAVIFEGEKYGLHNRVFLTNQGYPTYEAKELGLTMLEDSLFPYNTALHLVGNEQTEYFKVVIKALELLESRFIGRKKHIAYGLIALNTGKMSSRTGDVITAEELISKVKERIKQQYSMGKIPSQDQKAEKLAIAAIKFYMLKYSLESDIIFNIDQSIALQGDTGPYVIYTYARTQSLLAYSKHEIPNFNLDKVVIEEEEREVLRQLEYFMLVVERVSNLLQINELTFYLLNLSKSFNQFYQKYPIVGSKNAGFRLNLTKRVGEILAVGLYLLGIETIEKI